MQQHQIRHYLDPNGRDHFAEWRDQLPDSKVRIAIDRRVMRLEPGNFGDHKPLREGARELRIDTGADYRICYAKAGATVVLLLC